MDNKKNETLAQPLNLKDFYSTALIVDRACSTVLENSMGIFLPHKRLDISKVQETFYENNQTLTLQSELYDKVEIKGRLLCQTHKDILEVLLTSKKIWLEETRNFRVDISAYKILQKLGKSSGNKKWLEQKLDELGECRIKITFDNDEEETFNFNFIDAIGGRNKGDKQFSIVFSSSYSHLIAKNEMLDYSSYVGDILSIDHSFTKAVIRYMLMHNGRQSRITIENLVEKLNLKKVISEQQLKKDIDYIRSPEIEKMLKDTFGITLISDKKTLEFNVSEDKPRYHIQPTLDME